MDGWMDGWAHDFFNGLGVEGLHIQERVGRIDGGLGERDVDGAADVSACAAGVGHVVALAGATAVLAVPSRMGLSMVSRWE
jgi:hypothetical protein